MQHVEIVSHPLCPHAQRLVLIAVSKGGKRDTDFKVTYLAYPSLKETAGRYSPSGELPILRIDGAPKTVTTEHAAEFLDGVVGAGLLPPEPLIRLVVRERERKVRVLLDAMRAMFSAPSAEALQTATLKVFDLLTDLDADLADDGTTAETIRMDMAALAPACSLLTFHPGLRDHPRWEQIPRLRDIAHKLASNPLVLASRCPNYGAEFDEFFRFTKSTFPASFATAS